MSSPLMDDIDQILLPAKLHDRLLMTVLSRYPQKSFGYLTSESTPDRPSDFVIFEENIRNDDNWRSVFESRGRYFVDHPDAGFVATPEESWRVQKYLFEKNLTEAAVFHTHLRHPGNFSDIDYDLHISRFGRLRHLIISLRNIRMPQMRAFAVSKTGVRELGIRVLQP
jgi:proteasome lid subunit RPN8/RPN11